LILETSNLYSPVSLSIKYLSASQTKKSSPTNFSAKVDLPDPGQGTPLTRNKLFSGGAIFFKVSMYLLLEVFLIPNAKIRNYNGNE